MSLSSYRITRPGAERLLFLLHGWSSEQHHLAAYVPLVDPDERYTAVCPRAPHDLPDGDGASWFDRVDGQPVPESFLAALAAVDELVTTEAAAAGVTTEQCVIGGFSQGGFLALAMGLRARAPRYAGVWAMCCAMPDVDGLTLDARAGAGTPALVQVGERDPIITPDRGRAVAATLRNAGWQVTDEGYDMAHSQRIEMMTTARAWLSSI